MAGRSRNFGVVYGWYWFRCQRGFVNNDSSHKTAYGVHVFRLHNIFSFCGLEISLELRPCRL